MSLEQRAYFYQLLNSQKEELMQDSDSVLNAVKLAVKKDNDGVGDELDNSSSEQELAMNLKLADRRSNLLKKLDAALERLENGTYGYSVISGDEIGIARMLASPFATMTVEEKDEYERKHR
jgi:DnaK suppressor protein